MSSVSCRAWLRLLASLGTCSGLKRHSLSLRAEGKGQSLGKACRDYSPAVPQSPRTQGGAPTGCKGLDQDPRKGARGNLCSGSFSLERPPPKKGLESSLTEP